MATWETHLHRRYNLTARDFKELLIKQKYKCAICRDPIFYERQPGSLRASVDHDHETGRRRGLLCNHCNRGLGGFRDNIEDLERAVEYLREWKLQNAS